MENTVAAIEENRSCINPNQRSTTMETQGGQKTPTWVTENPENPPPDGTYDLMSGARFLFFALYELGLLDGSITQEKLEAAVHAVQEKQHLVAGDWDMLEACIELSRQLDFDEYKSELRKAAQHGLDNDAPL